MAEIEAFFDGWEIAEPGVDYMAKWRPETPLTGMWAGRLPTNRLREVRGNVYGTRTLDVHLVHADLRRLKGEASN